MTGQDTEDPKLAEFLEVVQPRLKSRMWGNDDVMPDGAEKSARGKPKLSVEQKSGNELSDLSDGSSGETSDEHTEEYMADSDDDGAEERSTADAELSDMDYLRRKVVADNKLESSDEELSDSGGGSGVAEESTDAEEDSEDDSGGGRAEDELRSPARQAHAEETSSPAQAHEGEAEGVSIAETGRLFLRNLPYTATEDDLRELFAPFGQTTDVHIVLDRMTGMSKGFAYVTFMMPEDAERAAAELDSRDFQGRLLHILPARLPRNSGAKASASEASFKKQREEERKSQAGNRAAWNSLFMRQDTVAEAVAAHFGITKSDLLDRDTSDLPVRMALGETHVIAATKKALAEAGAEVEALEAAAVSGKGAKVERSDTCLLVKNLPYSVTAEELLEMFEAAGPVGRLVLPPTRTIALVEYLEPQDARRGFRSLAYKRCHHVPLYLEWAPKGIFGANAPLLDKALLKGGDEAEEAAPLKDSAVVAGLADAEADELEGCRELFVKNLNFETRDKVLRKHFELAAAKFGGRVTAARVALKDGKRKGDKLSLGYGFVECDSEATARSVMKALQGSLLDGHKLALQMSNSSKQKTSASKPGAPAEDESRTKLLVRNVAFEATRKELASLFGAVGQLKSVRIPKKFDGNHRGFAFVEFVTQQEAQAAIDTVSGTHLYGRRLVVERAKEGEGVDELRAKTAAKMRPSEASGDAPPAKRKKAEDIFMDFM